MSRIGRVLDPVRDAGWAASHAVSSRVRRRPKTNGVAPSGANGASPAASNGAAPSNGAPPAKPQVDPELRLERDRLIEKYTIMQSDLGGAFYEMAIRDHVRLDVLTRRAAELQRVDAELAQVERSIELERTGAVGHCTNCDAPFGPGVAFCSQCGHPLVLTKEEPA